MDDPYLLCLINGCSKIAETHHEPLRSQLDKADYWRMKYNKDLCRDHHEERHLKGFAEFCADHPEYDGISVEEYRRSKRDSRG